MSKFNGLIVRPDPTDQPQLVEINDYTDIQRIVGGTFDVQCFTLPNTFYGDMEISVYMWDEPPVWNQMPNMRISMFASPHWGLDVIQGTVLMAGGVDNEGNQLSVHPALAEAFVHAHKAMLENSTDFQATATQAQARFN